MISGSELTRIGVIGFPGRAYAGFTAKTESAVVETPETPTGGFWREYRQSEEEKRQQRIELGILPKERKTLRVKKGRKVEEVRYDFDDFNLDQVQREGQRLERERIKREAQKDTDALIGIYLSLEALGQRRQQIEQQIQQTQAEELDIVFVMMALVA